MALCAQSPLHEGWPRVRGGRCVERPTRELIHASAVLLLACISDIVAGKRAVTADTDLRACRYAGLSRGWWLPGQASHGTACAKQRMPDEPARIPRCSLLTK
jgi:hypothetical protein